MCANDAITKEKCFQCRKVIDNHWVGLPMKEAKGRLFCSVTCAGEFKASIRDRFMNYKNKETQMVSRVICESEEWIRRIEVMRSPDANWIKNRVTKAISFFIPEVKEDGLGRASKINMAIGVSDVALERVNWHEVLEDYLEFKKGGKDYNEIRFAREDRGS